MRFQNVRGILYFVIAGLLGSSLCFGQDPRGTILGRVTDASGAGVPNADVRTVNIATGVSAAAQTNQSGNFILPYLSPGTYTLSAELAGFKRFVRERIEVRVSESVEVDVVMQVGNVTESVEVKADTPLLDTVGASLGQVIDQRRITELPQRGGNPVELALLTPGVANITNLRLRNASAANALSDISADGVGRFNNEFQIDGISNMAMDTGAANARLAFSPPSSAIGEFKMQTSPYDASVGHTSGALMNVSTLSGTNALHGELRYYGRNSAFDAPNFFNNKNGTKKTVYADNRYGAAAGGPVYLPKIYNGKNRTFWFYAWEANKWNVPMPFSGTVPTADERKGDFSALLNIPGGSAYQIYDPLTTTAAAGGRFQRQPFANNIIPGNRLDKVGVNLANIYALPNAPGTADGRNNYFFGDKSYSTYYVHMTKIDHAFSENHRFFVRFHIDAMEQDCYNDFQNRLNGYIIPRRNKGAALDDVLVINPTLVLNLRYGVTNASFLEHRITQGYDLASLGFSPALTSLVDKNLVTIPRVSVNGYSAISRWESGDGGNGSVIHSLAGNFTKLRGNHNLKFGTEFRLYRVFNARIPRAVSPDFAFNNSYTRGPLDNSPAAPIGQELASMLLGVPAGTMEMTATSALQETFYGLYLQDDYKVSNRLTVNIGLRYELERPFTERFNRLVAGFDSTTPNPLDAQARANYAKNPIPELAAADFHALGGLTWVNQNGSGRSPYRGKNNTFLPRIGLAYQLDSRTTLRAGYGIFFDTNGLGTTSINQTGFTMSTPMQASLDSGLTYVATNANPFPQGLMQPLGAKGGLATNLGQSISAYNPNLTAAYAQRWSLGIQRLLPGKFLLDASYVGNRGTHIAVSRDYNLTPARYLSTSPVRDQTTIDFLSRNFPNPFSGLNSIYGANMSRGSLLRPYPQFGSISIEEPIGYSWYHSMQVRAEKRFAQGYTFLLGYTFSKAMDATGFLNATDPRPYETLSSADRPHRLTMSGVWDIPVGKGRQFGASLPAVVNMIAGGWQLSGVVIRQAGAPLDWGNIIFTGNPDSIRLPKGQRSVDRWFNIDAGFNRISAQQLGSNIRTFPMRLGGLRRDGQASWDFGILKYFPIRETIKLQFRAEVYNAWNHSNFAAPNTSPTSSDFGRITSTDNNLPRQWQLAMRLIF